MAALQHICLEGWLDAGEDASVHRFHSVPIVEVGFI